MKKTIIFDNEWIIVKNDWNKVAETISNKLSVPLLSGSKLKQSFRLYDKTPENPNGNSDNPLYLCNRGLITSDQLWAEVLQSPAYDLEPTTERIKIMSSAMSKLTTDVDQDTVNLISKLKNEGYKLFILSNSTPDIYQGNRERHDYFNNFEKSYFSFDSGFRKPEEGAYLTLLNENCLKPKDCIFIDDKQENLDGAERLGMIPLYHKIGDVDKLEGKLRELLLE